MYAVTLLKQSTKEVLDLIGFVNSKEEFESIVSKFVTKYGAEWLGENDYGFGFELAI